MLNKETNWNHIISADHLIYMSEKDMLLIFKNMDLERLGSIYNIHQNRTFDVIESAEDDFKLPNKKYILSSRVLFNEIKRRIDSGEEFITAGYRSHDFKLYERCQRYLDKCTKRQSVTLYSWLQKFSCRYNNPYFGVYDRETLISNLEAIKRSDGYMEKRYEYISAIVSKGLMRLEDTNSLPRKLSKSFRERLLHKCMHVAHCLTQNIIRYEKLEEKNGMIYFMTIEETEKQRKYALMMCIELLPNYFSNYTVKAMINSLRKEDLSYMMPMLAVKKCNPSSKSDLIKEMKRLLVEK